MAIESRNPATDQVERQWQPHSEEEVRDRLAAAHAAHLAWRRTSFETRAQLLRRAGEQLRSRTEEFATLMAREMGKPISDGAAEVEKCAWVCDYYAEHGAAFLAPESIESDARSSMVVYRPLGVVLAVMPWNFPFWQVLRFAAPGLMAGNAGVLKHASNVPGCADAIEDVFRQAGFPEGLFAVLRVSSKQVTTVIESEEVKAVTLTGSTPAGRAVAAAAGKALKKTVLELGGSDPYVVLEDADIEAAAAACVKGRLVNTGQSCIAAKRWIVVDEVREAFVAEVTTRMGALSLGDPLDAETKLGPMARVDLRDELHEQVQASIEGGARCVLGGTVPDKPGAWYPPTLLLDVQPGTPAYDDELFGPVGAVLAARDEADALRIANDSPFGLGAAVFTRDLERGTRIASDALDAGCCFVNTFVRSDPRLPFGGIGESGYGRELGEPGIREFVNVKTVYVQ
jgi:succinate-semialdehyde dehydrogenase/glutarate-semialdehyde dehydrogenase